MNNVLINVMEAQGALFDAISQSNMGMKQPGLFDSSASSFQSTLNKEIKSTNSSSEKTNSSSKTSSASTDNSEDKLKTVKEKQHEKSKEEKISCKEENSSRSDKKKEKSSSEKDKTAADERDEDKAVSRATEETASAEQPKPVKEKLPAEEAEVSEESEDEELPVEMAVLSVVPETPVMTEEQIAAYWNAEADSSEYTDPEAPSEVEVPSESEPALQENILSSFMKKEKTAKSDSTAETQNVQSQVQQVQAQDAAAQAADELAESASTFTSVKEDLFIKRQDSKLAENGVQLNTGADFKLNSMKVEKLAPEADGTENPQEVLKNLLGRARAVSSRVNTNTSDAGNTNQGNQGNAFNLKSEIQNFLSQNSKESGMSLSPGVSKLAQQGFNGALDSVRSNGQSVSAGVKADAMNAIGQTQDISSTRSFMSSTSAQQTAYTGGTSANAALVGELINRMQTMLKGSNLDSGSKLSMDFESSSFGQVNLSVQQKGNTIAVNIQLSSDSSKDQLMQQREDLSNQLRMMGYKEVALDISAGKDQRENQQGKNKNSHKGNEDIQNVKLSGDDKADKATVATMYS